MQPIGKFRVKKIHPLISFLFFAFLLAGPTTLASEPTLPKADYVTSQTVKAWLQEGKSLLFIDVREPGEYEKGHIEDAVNIPYARVENHLEKLRTWNKETPLIFYCTHSSWRAPYSANLLKDHGFGNVYILEGGIVAWKGGGQTIQASHSDQVPAIVPYPENLKIVLKHPEPPHYRHRNKKENKEKQDHQNIAITLEELKRFDGKEGRPAYVAVDGKIYDVTQSRLWRGGVHDPSDGYASAGRDLSRTLKKSPHGKKELEKFPVVGKLVKRKRFVREQ